MRIGYILRESLTNLRRNVLMTVASLLTVTLSLALAGAALLFRSSVDNATVQFRGGFEITVFMQPEATKAQVDAIGRELKAMPELSRFRLVSKEEAFADIQRLYRNSPEILDSYPDAKYAPEQWRVKPRDAADIEAIGKRFKKRAGVYEVSFARSIKTILTVTGWIQNVILIVAGALLVSAIVLILNTIRMAIFSRRREVAVMKLVGATNGFIRLPFMVEGMLQGAIGALDSFGVLAAGTSAAQSAIRNSTVGLLKQFSVTGSEVVTTGIILVVIGTAVGAIGSALAVSRFLDV